MSVLNRASEYLLPREVPWAFRLMVLLVFALVGGGLFLDYQASNVSFSDVFASQERRKDPATGAEVIVEKLGLRTEDRQLLIDLAKAKAQRLNESAKLLYDFAKIALGALIASLTQLTSPRGRAGSSAPARGSGPTDRDQPQQPGGVAGSSREGAQGAPA